MHEIRNTILDGNGQVSLMNFGMFSTVIGYNLTNFASVNAVHTVST